MRYQGLDYDGALKVITKLAKFHALSYYIENESLLDLTQSTNGMFSKGIGSKMDFLLNNFVSFVDSVKAYGGYEDIVIEKLELIKPVFMKKLSHIYSSAENVFGVNVLNHGDFHIRNLLFVNNEDDIDKVSFIDFQICFWRTPAIDLYNILYAVASNETRDQHQWELLRVYHENFCSLLTDLGFLKKLPSLLDLNIELLRYGFLEILMASCLFFMEFSQMAEEVRNKQGNMSDAEEFQKKLYQREDYKNCVSKILPKLLYTGQLDL
ncbi:LOC111597534 [Sergentomyia squamirostris]